MLDGNEKLPISGWKFTLGSIIIGLFLGYLIGNYLAGVFFGFFAMIGYFYFQREKVVGKIRRNGLGWNKTEGNIDNIKVSSGQYKRLSLYCHLFRIKISYTDKNINKVTSLKEVIHHSDLPESIKIAIGGPLKHKDEWLYSLGIKKSNSQKDGILLDLFNIFEGKKVDVYIDPQGNQEPVIEDLFNKKR